MPANHHSAYSREEGGRRNPVLSQSDEVIKDGIHHHSAYAKQKEMATSQIVSALQEEPKKKEVAPTANELVIDAILATIPAKTFELNMPIIIGKHKQPKPT